MSDTRADPVDRQGTVWVFEDHPPATRSRWYAHWDGIPAPGFSTPEEAVSWGLERALTILVRTVGDTVYWAGERPSEWDEDELRPWPPSAAERRQIDVEYEAALTAANEDEAARGAYERERDEWLAVHAPDRVGRAPLHECVVLESEYDELGIEFEELAPGAALFGARRQGSGRRCFGSAETVIATTSGRQPTDPWVRAVCAALAREREWLLRRSRLAVQSIDGELFHVTAATNRESIARHGLDWRRMGAAMGIAGSEDPELPGVFLCESREDADFFLGMARMPVDIWAVRVDGLWLESGPDGWLLIPEPVEPNRVRLVEIDLPPRGRE